MMLQFLAGNRPRHVANSAGLLHMQLLHAEAGAHVDVAHRSATRTRTTRAAPSLSLSLQPSSAASRRTTPPDAMAMLLRAARSQAT